MKIAYRPSFLLADGHNFFIRHYVVNPTLSTNGERIGGVVGTLRGLRSLIERFNPTAVFFVWDGPGGAERRRSIRSEYKEGRRVRLNHGGDDENEGFADSAAEDLGNMDDQVAMTARYLDILGITQVRIPGVEADDTISYLCSVLEGQKYVVSTDADLLQLVSDDVAVYNPPKDRVFHIKEVLEERLSHPQNYALMKAVCGDKGDNVSGVTGIGPKTFVRLVPEVDGPPLGLSEMFDLISARTAETDVKGRPTALAKRAQQVMEMRAHVEENYSLVSLAVPLMSADAARAVRSLVASPQAYQAAGLRIEALRDGVQLREDFDKPMIMLATKTFMWAKRMREENDGGQGE